MQPKIGRTKTSSKKRIDDQIAERLLREFRIALKGLSAEKLFRKFDKDRSGSLSADEFTRIVRLQLRVPTSVVIDSDIEALITALDNDGGGSVSIDELLTFIERGTDALHGPSVKNEAPVAEEAPIGPVVPRKIQVFSPWMQAEVIQGGDAQPVACIDAIAPEICDYLVASLGYNPRGLYNAAFGLGMESSMMDPDHSKMMSRQTTPGGPIAKKPSNWHMKEESAKRIQTQLKNAMMHKSSEKIFKKFDKDKSGLLSADELKKMIRMELRLPETAVSDRDIEHLVSALDDDDSGSLSIAELSDFIEYGTATFFSVSKHEQQPAMSRQISHSSAAPDIHRVSSHRVRPPTPHGRAHQYAASYNGQQPHHQSASHMEAGKSLRSRDGCPSELEMTLPSPKAMVDLSLIEGLPLSASPSLWRRRHGERNARAAALGCAWTPRSPVTQRPHSSLGIAGGGSMMQVAATPRGVLPGSRRGAAVSSAAASRRYR
eukprot:TRINITY_DN102293_c0_g1_i1.p1 TRINITY_DN102293_c0_g1~~TRINITY_DN102293_c0_g1_i1.p1  ORF type:complete len:488 (+),score=124.04 TRINITY_DN102293_c0_g1_i1:54-1517(+)